MGQLLSLNELSKIISVPRYRINIWVKEKGLRVQERPIAHPKIRKHTYVDTDEFWKWGSAHKALLDVENIPPNSIPNEPAWVERERKENSHLEESLFRH